VTAHLSASTVSKVINVTWALSIPGLAKLTHSSPNWQAETFPWHATFTSLPNFVFFFCPPDVYTGCPKRNVPNFGRVFLMLNYTDITQNTYVQSWTFTEIMVREKCGLLAGPRTVPVSWHVLSMFVLECGIRWRKVSSQLHMCFLQGTLRPRFEWLVGWRSQQSHAILRHSCAIYSAWNPTDNYDIRASFFVVQFNGFMSLTI
jgi:hypothetical protein